MTDTPPLAGQVVVFAGAMSRMSRREAVTLVERQLGRVATAVTRETTLLVLGPEAEPLRDSPRIVNPDRPPSPDERKITEAHRLNARYPGRVRMLTLEEFYAFAGVREETSVVPPAGAGGQPSATAPAATASGVAAPAGALHAVPPAGGAAPESRAGEPQAREARTAEPRAAEARTAEPGAAEPGAATAYSSRHIRSLYPALRDDHLRYLERWGLIRPIRKTRHETLYGFADLAVIRQASAELARGLSVRAVLRALVAERTGQLAFDFQPSKGDTQPAKVVTLRPRVRAAAGRDPSARGDGTMSPAGIAPGAGTSLGRVPADEAFEMAARYFEDGSALDTGDDDQQQAAMAAYRRALAFDPRMVAALVNLANLHYAHDAIAEAEALYEKALTLEPTCFEARFNLGNVYHDTSRFEEAVRCYVQALALDPGYADAHFYLAVTLEKLGRSGEARPHWAAYQRLAPEGEWVELAREFSE